MRKMAPWLEYASVGFAFAAAALWLWASVENSPDTVDALMTQHGGMDILGTDLTTLVTGLIEEGRRNAYAAKCAAVAALTQGLSLILRKFSA